MKYTETWNKKEKTKVFQLIKETARILQDEKRVGHIHFNTEESRSIAMQTLKGLIIRLEDEV